MNINKPCYQLRVEGNALFFKVNGVLDLPILGEIFADVSAIIKDHLGDEWASVVDLSDWQLHTPEVEASIAKFQHWAAKHGQRVELCITSGSFLKKSAREDMLKNSPDAVNYVFVADLEEAENWLQEHNYLSI